MVLKANRRASPDLLAIRPITIAANRNQAVASAKPLKATSNFTMPSAQNKKQPTNPASANSVASVIHAITMNARMAKPCLTCGASSSGENQIASGTMMHRTCPIKTAVALLSSGPGCRMIAGVSGEVMALLLSGACVIAGEARSRFDAARRLRDGFDGARNVLLRSWPDRGYASVVAAPMHSRP